MFLFTEESGEIAMFWTNILINHLHGFLTGTANWEENIFSLFETTEEKHQAMVEYFLLSPEQQVVLSRYMKKQDYAHTYISCLGYIASCIILDREFLRKVPIKKAVSEFIELYGQYMPVQIDTEQILSLLTIQKFQENLTMTKEQIIPYFQIHSREIVYLCVFAIANNCSVWKTDKKASEILIEQSRKLDIHFFDALAVCTPEQIDTFVNEWIRPPSEENRNEEDELLFQVLIVYPKLSKKSLSHICDHLFKDNTITAYEALELLSEKCLNRKAINRYVSSAYRRSVDKGIPQYVYAQAVFKAHGDKSDAIRKAMDCVCAHADSYETIAALAVVSLAAWLQVQRSRARYLSIPFRISKTFIDKLIDMVSSGESACFNIAVNCIEDLYLLGWIDNQLLGQECVQAAVRMRQSSDADQRRHAEILLALIPFSVKLPRQFEEDYKNQYLHALTGNYKIHTVHLFRILAKTTLWDCCDDLISAYRELYLHAYDYQDELVEEDVVSLQRLKLEVLAALDTEIIQETSEAALDMMNKPLPEKEDKRITALKNALLADHEKTLVTDSEVEVASLLAYVKVHLFEPNICVLLERTKITNENIGSFLVVQWFVNLCRCSDSPQSVFSFWRQFSEILIRPVKYSSNTYHRRNNSEFSEYAQFLQEPCRLTAALEFAQTDTVKLFIRHQNELPEELGRQVIRMLADRLSLGSKATVQPAFQEQLNEPSIYDNPMAFWERYYDDRAITKIALKQVPAAAKTILLFGYADDLDVAQVAVREHPWNIRYLSARLREHPLIRKILPPPHD